MLKRVEQIKKELQKLESVVPDIQKQIFEENEKKRPLNQKKFDALKAGATRQEIQKIDKELHEVNGNVMFLKEQLDVMKEVVADEKHKLVQELLDIREEYNKYVHEEMSNVKDELEALKYEYMKRVYETYTVKKNEFHGTMQELNELIRRNGDGKRFSNPRVLTATTVPSFYAPTRQNHNTPFIHTDDVQKAISPSTSYTFRLYLETGEILPENDARLKLEKMKKGRK